MEWLSRARSDLALSRIPLPDGATYEDLCFHAQQAAEKAIKALYRAEGLAFRYTHDIAELLNGLAAEGVDIPEAVLESVELTTYAWQARYPGLQEPTTDEDHVRAISLADSVVTWVAAQVEG
jgi:HEPN domain-containing protein